ncbi:DinB family protein [Mucilaginibacter sp.]
MNIAAEKKKLDAALDEYRRRLDIIADEQFTQTPPKGGWSYAEVYSHIMQADLASAIAMQKCMQGNCRPSGKKPTLKGRLVLWLGMFPPFNRYKVPEAVAARMPVQKIDKEEARNLIIKCRKRIAGLLPQLADAAPHCTTAHPALGHLNAAQWLRFIRIHTGHHLKQLKRIDREFKRLKQ